MNDMCDSLPDVNFSFVPLFCFSSRRAQFSRHVVLVMRTYSYVIWPLSVSDVVFLCLLCLSLSQFDQIHMPLQDMYVFSTGMKWCLINGSPLQCLFRSTNQHLGKLTPTLIM